MYRSEINGYMEWRELPGTIICEYLASTLTVAVFPLAEGLFPNRDICIVE
jgi:hypothetical protein